MAIDVLNEIVIGRPREVVAAYAMDAANDTHWITALQEALVVGGGAVRLGSEVRRRASMLRRSIRYVYEVTEMEPGLVLDMRSVEGPFAMATRYEFTDAGEGRTRMRIRNRGGPGGVMRLLDPLMRGMVRRQVGKDLQRLRRILESA